MLYTGNMALSDDEKWLLGENLKRQEKEAIAGVERGEDGSRGDFGAYYALLTGKNTDWVKAHAVSDERYLASYARQLNMVIREERAERGALSLLDVGCGPGMLTAMLSRKLPNCRARGIDVSESAIEYGRRRHPNCRFDVVTVDAAMDLRERFDVVHAREFYPFTRTGDLEFHRTYVEALARHVGEQGVLVLALLSSSKSLATNAAALAPSLEAGGMTRFRIVTVASSRFPDWVPSSVARAATELSARRAGRAATHFYISRRAR
jgi:SAM-dependent methyltransferase